MDLRKYDERLRNQPDPIWCDPEDLKEIELKYRIDFKERKQESNQNQSSNTLKVQRKNLKWKGQFEVIAISDEEQPSR